MTLPLASVQRGKPSAKPQWEVADVFRQSGEAYRNHHALPASTQKIMHDIETCRCVEKGGHVKECDHCGWIEIAYNSCRNRHWLGAPAQMSELGESSLVGSTPSRVIAGWVFP